MKLLFKLLRKNVSFWQLAGFALANLVGAAIVLFGIQAYKDAGQVLKAPDSVIGDNFLVLSKPVSAITTFAGALGAGPRTFTQDEMDALAKVDGVRPNSRSMEDSPTVDFRSRPRCSWSLCQMSFSMLTLRSGPLL